MARSHVYAWMLVFFSLGGMFLWDELGSLYAFAPFHVRLLSYGLFLAAGWAGGMSLWDAQGVWKGNRDSVPSLIMTAMGAVFIADGLERGSDVQWNINSLQAFGHHGVLYAVGIACAILIRKIPSSDTPDA